MRTSRRAHDSAHVALRDETPSLTSTAGPDTLQAVTYTDGVVTTTIELRVYRLAAIKKAGYRLANRCTLELGAPGDEHVPATLRFRPGTSEETALEAVRAFFEELLDQELREQLSEETASLRTLILAHAYSKIDLLRRD